MSYRRSRTRLAFSLIELLVVIAIIVVLIAILLPTIAAARRSAIRMSCASNMRQVGAAFLAYAGQHNGAWPAPALAWNSYFDEDWVHWQPGRDVRNSSIMRYIGNDADVLKCPAGVPDRAETIGHGGRRFPAYPFSYAVNVAITGDWVGPPPYRNPGRCRLHHIVGASHKVLVLEEEVGAINDGAWWCAIGSDYTNGKLSSISSQHDRGREHRYEDAHLDRENRFARGNVVFADGHWEFLERWKVGTSYYGLPEREGSLTD